MTLELLSASAACTAAASLAGSNPAALGSEVDHSFAVGQYPGRPSARSARGMADMANAPVTTVRRVLIRSSAPFGPLLQDQIGTVNGVPQTLYVVAGRDGHFGSCMSLDHWAMSASSSLTFRGFCAATLVVSLRSVLRLNSRV